jgi:predicted O-methyltransferase YrrM
MKRYMKRLIWLLAIRPLRYISYRITVVGHDIQPQWASDSSSNSLMNALRERAVESSAAYVEKNLDNALLFERREDLWKYALSKCTQDGIYIEFGVYLGYSVNYLAGLVSEQDTTIYGFDSFEGLMEDYPGTGHTAGNLDLGGVLPKVLPNVTLVDGWFHETLPTFLSCHSGQFSFVHFDADTYEATTVALELSKERITSGTIAVFDEYLCLVNWNTGGEYRAWQEFSQKESIDYSYIGFSGSQVAIKVL